MQLNEEQNAAVKLMIAGRNIFLHGDAGTGKTAVINRFIFEASNKVICLASTGIAARHLGAGGVTLHRFLSLLKHSTGQSKQELSRMLKAAKAIVIEEISMVRSDLFVDFEYELRRYVDWNQPFGGLQIIVVGDFFQLPPVVENLHVSKYLHRQYGGIFAFETSAWKTAGFMNVALHTPYRQSDPEFLALLHAVRYNSADLPYLLRGLDSHVGKLRPGNAPCLCCTRDLSNCINSLIIKDISAPEKTFHGCRTGSFPENELPTEVSLKLKYSMFVVILANDPDGHYVNGDLGSVEDWDDDAVYVQLERGGHVRVTPYTWTHNEYRLDEDSDEIRLISKEIGHFRQIPLAPGYAMTIHKAQGQSLNKLHVALGFRPCFAPGQLYTALSRARSLSDLSLSRPLTPADVIVDDRVARFYHSL